MAQDQVHKGFILGPIFHGLEFLFATSHLLTRMLGVSRPNRNLGLGLCFRRELGAIIFREHPAATQQFR